jgi:hypothetical protein
MPSTWLTCLAMDPVRPGSLYAGLMSANSRFRGEFLSSRDGGAHWITQTIDSWPSSIAVDSKAGTIYLGGEKVLRSTDGGTTWSGTALSSQRVSYAVLADALKETVFAGGNVDMVETGWGLYASGGSISRSVDGGSTWSSSNLPNFDFDSVVMSLSKDAQSTAYYAGTWGGALYRSTDGGANWQLLSTLPGTVASLALDPSDSSFLYAVTPNAGVLRSTDGGASWWSFNSGMSGRYVTSLTIDSTGRVLHAGTDEGVFDYQINSGAFDISVGRDDKARLLFKDPHERLTLRTMDGSGDTASQTYGRYSGWSPKALADGPDGLTRVLWTHADGSAGIWFVSDQGINQASYRLGPVQGWTAIDVASGTPGTTRILWAHENGAIGFWAVDFSGHISYGPKLAPDPDWTAVAIADGADGLTRLLQTRGDGSAELSLVGPNGLFSIHQFGRGDRWKAIDIAVGADLQSRILWRHADGRMSLWRVDGHGNITAPGPIYAPPTGFAAQRVGAGPDGHTQVLWTNPDGSALLWQMSADNVFQQSFPVSSN